MRHLCEIVVDGKPVDMPFHRFFQEPSR
jgi:hypothetical protein